MKVRLEPITAKVGHLDGVRAIRAVENAGNMSAKAVEVDFNVTTKTWKTRPSFQIDHTPGQLVWEIYTEDDIYRYVSEGTKAHVIRPRKAKRLAFFRTGFRPKSVVGWIGSKTGAPADSDLTFVQVVHHPGTTARQFAETIKKKWDLEWPRQIQRAIRSVERYG